MLTLTILKFDLDFINTESEKLAEGIETRVRLFRSLTSAAAFTIILPVSQLEAALNVFAELFFHYSKTEFFYIDKAFEYSKNDVTTRDNLKKFDEIKNEGRIFLNKLFFGHESYIERVLEILQAKFSVSSGDGAFCSASLR